MEIEYEDNALVLRPEDGADRAFLERVLGLKRSGDEARAVRCDAKQVGFGRKSGTAEVRITAKEGE